MTALLRGTSYSEDIFQLVPNVFFCGRVERSEHCFSNVSAVSLVLDPIKHQYSIHLQRKHLVNAEQWLFICLIDALIYGLLWCQWFAGIFGKPVMKPGIMKEKCASWQQLEKSSVCGYDRYAFSETT